MNAGNTCQIESQEHKLSNRDEKRAAGKWGPPKILASPEARDRIKQKRRSQGLTSDALRRTEWDLRYTA